MKKMTEKEIRFTEDAWAIAQNKDLKDFDIQQAALEILAYMMKKDEKLTNQGTFEHRTSTRMRRMRGMVLMVLDELEIVEKEKQNANQTQNQNSQK